MLTKPEIRLAAEAIACTAIERGASPEHVHDAINRAFRRDSEKARAIAHDFAAAWMAETEKVPS